MFKKILIANRGEIACRIIETARKLDIQTVAVYSDVDRRARHVRMADEAYHIGGAASAESYLKGDVILQVAIDTGAEAIHPGYGFLSENAEFADACIKADLRFIGPTSASILAMGLKDKAKDIMTQAGVSVVPGYQGDKQDDTTLSAEAGAIGYPVLIKAVAGGGGKGMRLVEQAADLVEALHSCQREAKASFGNDHVLIEKYITKPRHIEVQVFGDTRGNVVHLFERDCSLQRRHQKVIEEAPAPGISETMREAMGQAAVKAAAAIDYHGAGTIEFIVDVANGIDDAPFYFMEMNTRLQVEHPVTEMITGQDLVEWQLRVAAGEELPLKQDELSIKGHAFEVRLYAEDPGNEFLPQAGRILDLKLPVQKDVRFDTGVEKGDTVTIHYDPMIAKLIAHGNTREQAALTMRQALYNMCITGLYSNQEFLSNIFAHEVFLAGDVDTGFIPRHADKLLPSDYGQPDIEELALAAVYFLQGLNRPVAKKPSPWDVKDNWRMGGHFSRSLTFVNRGEKIEMMVDCRGDDVTLVHDGRTCHARLVSCADDTLTIVMDSKQVAARYSLHHRDLTLCHQGKVVTLHLLIEGSEGDDDSAGGRILTPMPGKVVDVMVKQGDTVDKDQPLLIMEAMKMEITIRAGCAGVVEELAVSANDQVSDGALLVEIVSADAEST